MLATTRPASPTLSNQVSHALPSDAHALPPSDTPSAVLPGPVPPSSWRIAMLNLGLPAAYGFTP